MRCTTPRRATCGSSAWPTTSNERCSAFAKPACRRCWPLGWSGASERSGGGRRRSVAALQVSELCREGIEPLFAQAVLEEQLDVSERSDVSAKQVTTRVGVRADGDQDLEYRGCVAA